MSAKKKKKKKPTIPPLQLFITIILVIMLVAVVSGLMFGVGEGGDLPGDNQSTGAARPSQSDGASGETKPPAQLETVEDKNFNLIDGLQITDIGSYTGIYMEDGSDEVVSRVLMIVLTNNGVSTLQYAEIVMAGADREAVFTVSTLPAGESVVLLEQTRMAYTDADEFTSAIAQNVTFFTEPLSLLEDRLKIQAVQGAINVTNISGADITGDIVIYYKNSSSDMFYGGITYRARIEGGLKDGELRQIVPSHFSADGSTILFVTCE